MRAPRRASRPRDRNRNCVGLCTFGGGSAWYSKAQGRTHVMTESKCSWNGTQRATSPWTWLFTLMLTALSLSTLLPQIRSFSLMTAAFGPAQNLPSSVTGLMNVGPRLPPCLPSSSVYSGVILLCSPAPSDPGFPLQSSLSGACLGFLFLPFPDLFRRFPKSKTVSMQFLAYGLPDSSSVS